jgi:tetratricopeptide (TPR) repeat protein
VRSQNLRRPKDSLVILVNNFIPIKPVFLLMAAKVERELCQDTINLNILPAEKIIYYDDHNDLIIHKLDDINVGKKHFLIISAEKKYFMALAIWKISKNTFKVVFIDPTGDSTPCQESIKSFFDKKGIRVTYSINRFDYNNSALYIYKSFLTLLFLSQSEDFSANYFDEMIIKMNYHKLENSIKMRAELVADMQSVPAIIKKYPLLIISEEIKKFSANAMGRLVTLQENPMILESTALENEVNGQETASIKVNCLQYLQANAEYRKAEGYFKEKSIGNAIIHYEKAIAIMPDLLRIYPKLARCYRVNSNMKEAEHCFVKALALKKAGTYCEYGQFIYCQDASRWQDAIIMFENSVASLEDILYYDAIEQPQFSDLYLQQEIKEHNSIRVDSQIFSYYLQIKIFYDQKNEDLVQAIFERLIKAISRDPLSFNQRLLAFAYAYVGKQLVNVEDIPIKSEVDDNIEPSSRNWPQPSEQLSIASLNSKQNIVTNFGASNDPKERDPSQSHDYSLKSS